MDLTYSYRRLFPEDILDKYKWLETRNAAAVFQASNPEEFDQLVQVLTDFQVYDSDILVPGGNRGQIPVRLDKAFEIEGWRAVRVNTEFKLVGKAKASMTKTSYDDVFLDTTVSNNGFEVDNMKRRVALDVEWNAKDGNLDRDTSAYRMLYELGIIDVAAIITRDHYGIKRLALEELNDPDAARRLGTTTTTNMEKLSPRMTRGDSGGCPLLGIGITEYTWAGPGVKSPTLSHEEIEATQILDRLDDTIDES